MWDIVTFRLLVYFLSFMLFYKGVKYLRVFCHLQILKATGRFNPKVAKAKKSTKAESNNVDDALLNDSVSAMVHLGYTKRDATVAVKTAMANGANDFESIVKAALMGGH